MACALVCVCAHGMVYMCAVCMCTWDGVYVCGMYVHMGWCICVWYVCAHGMVYMCVVLCAHGMVCMCVVCMCTWDGVYVCGMYVHMGGCICVRYVCAHGMCVWYVCAHGMVCMCMWDDVYVCGHAHGMMLMCVVYMCMYMGWVVCIPVPYPGTCSKYSSLSALETKQKLADDTLYLSSLEHVLKDISEVYALESVVSHMDLGYSGTVDCIGKYK